MQKLNIPVAKKRRIIKRLMEIEKLLILIKEELKKQPK